MASRRAVGVTTNGMVRPLGRVDAYNNRSEGGHIMEVQTVGIDLGKNVFHIVGLDAGGKVRLRRRVTRSPLCAHRQSGP
jgi:hypothetical protein